MEFRCDEDFYFHIFQSAQPMFQPLQKIFNAETNLKSDILKQGSVANNSLNPKT